MAKNYITGFIPDVDSGKGIFMALKAVIQQITNPANNHILYCKFGTNNNLFLGLLNGKNHGIAVSAKSFLERTPACDGFIKKILADGFTQEHVDFIDEALRYYNKM